MTDLTNDASLNLSSGASGDNLSRTGTSAGMDSSMDFPGSVSGDNYSESGSSSGDTTRAQDFAANTTRDIENRAYQARDWALTQSDTMRETVLDKPFASIGTAFAAGIIFGMLLRR